MKRCPECRRDYFDDSLLYCLDDGSALLEGPASVDEPKTAIFRETVPPNETQTRAQIHDATDQTVLLPTQAGLQPVERRQLDKRLLLAPIALAAFALAGFGGFRYFNSISNDQITSIAVLP